MYSHNIDNHTNKLEGGEKGGKLTMTDLNTERNTTKMKQRSAEIATSL